MDEASQRPSFGALIADHGVLASAITDSQFIVHDGSRRKAACNEPVKEAPTTSVESIATAQALLSVVHEFPAANSAVLAREDALHAGAARRFVDSTACFRSHHILIGVLAVSVGVLTCCGSRPHARSIGRGEMPIVLIDFARNLKITRFTIDVLMQRLEHLGSPCDGTTEQWSRFVGLTHESVAACDQLHNALRAKFSGMQSLDTGSITFLNAGFAELHRKIAESIARLNSFEYATAKERSTGS
jgi:hypothetical protein